MYRCFRQRFMCLKIVLVKIVARRSAVKRARNLSVKLQNVRHVKDVRYAKDAKRANHVKRSEIASAIAIAIVVMMVNRG